MAMLYKVLQLTIPFIVCSSIMVALQRLLPCYITGDNFLRVAYWYVPMIAGIALAFYLGEKLFYASRLYFATYILFASLLCFGIVVAGSK